MRVAIGDSVTFGQYVDVEKRWTTLAGIVNRGVCGDTTRGALERFPRDVQDMGASVVFIQFGFNDCNRWQTDRDLPRVSPAAFHANLKEMILRCRVFDAEPILVGTYPTGKSGRYEADRAVYDGSIRDVAQVMDCDLVVPTIGPELLLDGLHLNEAGHAVYAEMFQ